MKRIALLLLLSGAAAYGQTPTPSPPSTISISNFPFNIFNPNVDTLLGWDNTDKTFRPFYLSGLTYNHSTFTITGGVTVPLPLTLSGIGAAQVDALQLINPTNAANNAQQYSPDIRWQGSGWKTNTTPSPAGPQMIEWRAYAWPAQDAAAPENYWALDSRTNGTGLWTTRLFVWDGLPEAVGTWLFVDSLKINNTAGGTGRIEFGNQTVDPPSPTGSNVILYGNNSGNLIAKRANGQTSRMTHSILTLPGTAANPTINTDIYDTVTITNQSTAITSFTTNLTGTPNDFDKLLIRIADTGAANAITWGNSFVSSGVTLPANTVAGKTITVGLVWDAVRLNGASVAGVWTCVAVDYQP